MQNILRMEDLKHGMELLVIDSITFLMVSFDFESTKALLEVILVSSASIYNIVRIYGWYKKNKKDES
jgi:hypothetical protein